MVNYMDKIRNVQSLDELMNIFRELSVIYKKDKSVENELNLVNSILIHTYNKKHDELLDEIVNLRVADLKEEKESLLVARERLSDFVNVCNFSLDENDDVETVRKKVRELFDLHLKYNVRLNNDEIKISPLIKRYFKIILNSKDPDGDVVKFVLSEFDSYEYFVKQLDATLNKIKGDDRDFVQALRPAFKYVKFGGCVYCDNAESTLKNVNTKLSSITDELDSINEQDYSSVRLTPSFTIEGFDEDKRIEEILKKLLGDKYDDASSNIKNIIYSDLEDVAKTIVTYRLFEVLLMEYLKYNGEDINIDCDTNKIDKMRYLNVNLEILENELSKFSSKKSIFPSREERKVKKQIKQTEKELDALNEECIDYVEAKKEYSAYYDDLGFLMSEVNRLRQENNVSPLFSEDGDYKFESLPIGIDLLNSQDILYIYDIKVNKENYEDILMACVRLLGDQDLMDRIDNTPRIVSGISDQDLKDIVNGKYDFLMKDLSVEEVYKRTRKKNNA